MSEACKCGCGGVPAAASVDVPCRRCGTSLAIPHKELRRRRTLEFGTAGPTRLCRRCVGRDALRIARQKLLATYGVGRHSSEEERRQAFMAHLELATAKAGGRDKLDELWRRGAAQPKSEDAKRRHTLGRIANTRRRRGEFRLCLHCHKLLYLHPAKLVPTEVARRKWNRRPALGLHRGCFREWERSPEFLAWFARIRSLDHGLKEMHRRRDPMRLPAAPRGKPARPEQLDRHFRWLIRHFGLGESWREIGERDDFDHAAVLRGVRSLLDVLPPTWHGVFCGMPPGKHLDELLPIARLHAIARVAEK